MQTVTVDLATLMDLCNEAFYPNREIVRSLTRWLRDKAAKNVIDVAGGTGFPLIDLAELGHDTTYVDGSATMHSRFVENAIRRGLHPMPSNHLCRWGKISATLDRRFDALLCRGNSLAYANSWRDARTSQPNEVSLETALADFYELLVPGGWVYLDKYRLEPGLSDCGRHRFSALIPYREEQWFLEWEVETLASERRRIWRVDCKNETSATVCRFELPSLLFTADDLVSACRRVGFDSVRILPDLFGEDTFEIVEARRPYKRSLK